jgi:hypothetical protein
MNFFQIEIEEHKVIRMYVGRYTCVYVGRRNKLKNYDRYFFILIIHLSTNLISKMERRLTLFVYENKNLVREE